MKKYEFTGETKEWYGRTLHRIVAMCDFGDVKKGNIGGWIEKEDNLSHEGTAWVYGDAQVYGTAWVYGDARVYGNARVYGDAQVRGTAWVYGDARVYGNARVYGDAEIKSPNDLYTVGPIGSRNDTTTFFRTKENTILVATGCFRGSIDEFEEAVRNTHGDNKYAKEYQNAIAGAKLHIELE